MATLEHYLFKVRDEITGKWRQTRYRLTTEIARKRYGEGNYELLEWSREVREGDAARLTAGHLASSPTKPAGA